MKTSRILQLIAIAAVSLLLAQCMKHDLTTSPPSGPDPGLDRVLPA